MFKLYTMWLVISVLGVYSTKKNSDNQLNIIMVRDFFNCVANSNHEIFHLFVFGRLIILFCVIQGLFYDISKSL